MQKSLFIFYLIALSFTCLAQQDELNTVESLLLDSRYQDAIRFIDGIISYSKDQTHLSLKKAEALIRLGKLNDAGALLKSLEGSVASEKKFAYYQALLEMNYGVLYQNQGRYDLSIDALHKSLNHLEQDNRASSLDAAMALSYLGDVYRTTGKYAQAEAQLQHALAIREEKLPETHELIAASYNDLGLIYSQLDADKAFDYYEKALSLYQKLHGSDHPKLAIANTNLGVLNLSEKLYGDAITYFEAALAIWEQIYTQPHPNKALVQLNLGRTYSQMGNEEAALAFYKKALDMYEASQGKKSPDVAYAYNLLGNEELARQKFDLALTYYQQALIANVPEFNNQSTVTNPTGTTFYNGTQLLFSLENKARALESRYQGRTLKDSDLVLAIQTLQIADSLIDRLRQSAANESDKIMLGTIANEVYADGVRITHQLSEVALRHRKRYREQSFYFAEKSKSAVLLEAISDTNAKSFANIPDELLEEEKSIKAAIALVSQKLALKPSEEEEKYFRETLFSLNRSYLEFTKHLENQYPEYYNLKFNSASPSIAQLQQLLSDKTALISYFIDEKNNRLYTFVITKKGLRIAEAGLPKAYDKYITGLRNSLYYMEARTFTQVSRTLYKLLIPKKMLRQATDLVIIPTGRMGVVPFESLLTNDVKGEPDYKALPYLINQFSVRYEFSAGLVLQKKLDPPAKISSVMLCAPITFPEKDNLSDLPGTETEIKTIAHLFDEKHIVNRVFLHANANESEIKSEKLKNYNLVHFATHGVVDETSPELSRIFLQSESDAEDGNLFAGEIYNLQFNAELVALSACQTGLGKISKGEGVIGLSRALVYAGAKNILVSLWSVGDESTAELMTGFYKQLLENPSAGFTGNLRQAKLDLLKGNFAAPYYWAPFILIGF